MAQAGRRLFTSDLSVSEFVLTRDAGCEPISQVTGSSVYHVGRIQDYKGLTGELDVISAARRESRRTALRRLFLEAARVHADAVIGVRLSERMITMGARGKGGDDGGEVQEFTVVGTAVQAPWIAHDKGLPIVTDLSGQDLWALSQDGYMPCGFLFEFCRYHVFHVTYGVGPGCQELDDAGAAVQAARDLASQRLLAQAARCEADFLVGSALSVELREVPCGYQGCEHDDLDINVSWFGTAIRRAAGVGPAQPGTPPRILPVMPLGRRRGAQIDAEDDTDDVAVAAEEAEEAALEADEAIEVGEE